MVKAALLALAAMVATPSVTDACINGTEWTVNDDIRMVKKSERHLENGQYELALRTLKYLRPADKRLQARMADIRAIIAIRMHDGKADLSKWVAQIETRDDAAKQKDIKFRAWRAEAYVAVGKRDEAKLILDDLHARDLVPDAYGYLALAKVTSGPTRLEMWKACRTRAKDKSMCELPSEVASARARKAPTR